MQKPLSFDISHLLKKGTGASEVYSFIETVEFEDIDAQSDISGKVEIMRLEDCLNVVIRDVEIDVVIVCGKCLASYFEKIRIPLAERQFFFERPKIIEDLSDLFIVDKKRLTIDITEMLRQEILLHFPIINVCSQSCKGICPHCGKNRNKVLCECIDEEIPVENKPLSVLKKLIKPKHG